MPFVDRLLSPLVLKLLKDFPVVYINGPRQAGKTTLVRNLATKGFTADFVTFDNTLDRIAASQNPLNYLKSSPSALIIDEVQLVREIFRSLKMMVDEGRFHARESGKDFKSRYLLTGSANLMILPDLADAMVGRMATCTLLPLSARELSGADGNFIDRCFTGDFGGISAGGSDVQEMMRHATFPELSTLSDDQVAVWLENYIAKITLEDPQSFYNLEKASRMPVLLQALATRAGSLLNEADLARDVKLNAVTTRGYRQILNGTFITDGLTPWYRNINKRLVRSPKVYFMDTMVLSYLLHSSNFDPGSERFGHLLENFIFTELVKQNNVRNQPATISFFRTHEAVEVDFILESNNRFVAVEVKYAESVTERDLRGLREFRAIVGDQFQCGIILCNTNRVISMEDKIFLVPLNSIWS